MNRLVIELIRNSVMQKGNNACSASFKPTEECDQGNKGSYAANSYTGTCYRKIYIGVHPVIIKNSMFGSVKDDLIRSGYKYDGLNSFRK